MTSLPTMGIVSTGEMGLGISKSLLAHHYRVIANVSDRRLAMPEMNSEKSLDDHYIARQPVNVLSLPPLSCIPATAYRIAEIFAPRSIPFFNGGIIDGPPRLQSGATWSKPSLVISGLHALDGNLAKTLDVTHIAGKMGPASGLKMCFASIINGLTAIAIQSFTTAHELGVLYQLQSHLTKFSPMTGELAAKGLVNMPPNAYRWVDGMKEIATTFQDEGFFEKDLFEAVSEVYDFVANETELGKEETGHRKVGKTPDNIVKLVADGMRNRLANL